MDYKKYIEVKALGNTEIIKAGGGYAFATKRFDTMTGEPVVPEIVSIDVDKLEEAKTNLQKDIADIEALQKDIANL